MHPFYGITTYYKNKSLVLQTDGTDIVLPPSTIVGQGLDSESSSHQPLSARVLNPADGKATKLARRLSA